ncbi:hypothetical protein EXS66_00965 [Candidatus Saccharibacteria bacterium]|nr:hypothetical protein [Candidatus Saccharibacteria bacterium]
MKKYRKAYLAAIMLIFLLSAVLFMFSLFSTNPSKLGPAGVTFWFINLLLMLSSLITIIFYKIRSRKPSNKDNLMAILRGSLRTGLLIGFSISLLLALSSLRALSWRDIMLLLLIVVLVEVFFLTRKGNV